MDLFLSLLAALAQDATTPGELRTYSTIHSIGIEWDIAGDADHDASCQVSFRAKGAEAWRHALPLFRVESYGWYADRKADRRYTMVAGSILFLEPGTAYDVKLNLADPDGGAESRVVEIATRPIPRLPEGGRTLHAVPGSGGGEGSKDTPFRGLAAAQEAARPGDVVLLGPGEYGAFVFSKSGEPGRPLAWKAAEDGGSVFDSADVAASHVHLEGLSFRKKDRDTALRGSGPTSDVALVRSRFSGFFHSVVVGREGRDWYVADNVIEGRNGLDPKVHHAEGEGVELSQTSGHTVCHNRISRVQAGVHYPLRNCDIFGNDIHDTTDDGLEPDYGYANVRMWGNRITNFGNNALSFQPMYCGPWYFIRNQVIGTGHIFKFRIQDRFLLAHNTFVRWGPSSDRMWCILSALSRNNLFISAGGDAPVWGCVSYKEDSPAYIVPPVYRPTWATDVDYDGFDWGRAKEAFSWDRRYPDLAAFSAAVGIEKNGVRVRKEEIFEAWDLPEKPAPAERRVLSLREGSNAVDAGAVLPNVNEDFAGKAPDLGAHERGGPRARYGPRPAAPVSADVFVSGRDGYHTYRIPSALVTPKGTLLAFCEGRKNGRSDTGDIDLLLRRSTDGGATWGPTQVVWDDGPNTCGNPCPVVDRETGTIWLLLTHNLGKDPQSKILDGTSEGTRTVWVTRSDDDGLTWARPLEITKDVKKPDWTWYATGPGVGIQLRTGRLVVPCDYSVAGSRTERAHVITSDDRGATWKLGGSTDEALGESQVVELSDGTLMINMRNHGSPRRERGVALSRDGGLTWEPATHDATLIEPQCQASILRHSPGSLLFLNPASTKARERMTVRLSLDEGKTWPRSKEIYAGPAAYSCLAVLPDGSIGCLYEAGEKHAYERIVFTRLTLDALAR